MGNYQLNLIVNINQVWVIINSTYLVNINQVWVIINSTYLVNINQVWVTVCDSPGARFAWASHIVRSSQKALLVTRSHYRTNWLCHFLYYLDNDTLIYKIYVCLSCCVGDDLCKGHVTFITLNMNNKYSLYCKTINYWRQFIWRNWRIRQT